MRKLKTRSKEIPGSRRPSGEKGCGPPAAREIRDKSIESDDQKMVMDLLLSMETKHRRRLEVGELVARSKRAQQDREHEQSSTAKKSLKKKRRRRREGPKLLEKYGGRRGSFMDGGGSEAWRC